MNFTSSAYAQQTSPPPAPGAGSTQPPSGVPGGAPQQPGLMGMLTLVAPMLLVMYFLMIRPQQKKMKEHQGMLEKIQHGDEVVTNAGIFGKVTGVTEKVLTVEIADGVRVKMLKSQVASVNPKGA